MSDRELLEMAAKAIGMEGCTIKVGGRNWNPLRDEGDRYRLARKLDMRVHFGPGYVTYIAAGRCGLVRWPEDAADDAYAIVQAAAAIGAAK